MAASPALRALRQAAPTISVGMLTANLAHLGDELAVLERAGADIVTIHVESTRHPHRALQVLGAMTNARAMLQTLRGRSAETA